MSVGESSLRHGQYFLSFFCPLGSPCMAEGLIRGAVTGLCLLCRCTLGIPFVLGMDRRGMPAGRLLLALPAASLPEVSSFGLLRRPLLTFPFLFAVGEGM